MTIGSTVVNATSDGSHPGELIVNTRPRARGPRISAARKNEIGVKMVFQIGTVRSLYTRDIE